MCGINGILSLAPTAAPVSREELLRTRDSMASRGPDGAGEWISADGTVGLAHRRLAIIDLSDAGRQPMEFDCGRYQIVFNGEIYNYRDLRAGLIRGGAALRSHSDTEVLLALYAREGPEMLGRLRGMYTMAIWDERDRRLFLARDPYGIKPLYYATAGDRFRFASQVRALEASGGISLDVDPAGVVGFLLWGSVPEPWTIRRDVRALPAGSYLLLDRDGTKVLRPHPPLRISHGERDMDLPSALRSSVRAHLESDVPVAIFLSSGIDSSMIAAMARREVEDPPTTLTLTFDEFVGTDRDEGPLAAEIARTIGARHVERRIRRDDFRDLWPRALRAMDQPSIDGFNTFVVSRAAHEAGFKVVLSGLGGDEIFGGYASFHDVPAWAAWSRRLAGVPGLAPLWPRIAATLRPNQPKLRALLEYGPTLAGSYYLRRGLYLPAELPGILDDGLARAGLQAYSAVGNAEEVLDGPALDQSDGRVPEDLRGWYAVHRMESSLYMRNQLLRDSDWASMAHSLELRVPLVDPWLLASVASHGFEPARSGGKADVIRRAAPELPVAIRRRPKTGFTVPVMQWLEGSDGSHQGLDSRRLALAVLREFGVTTSAAAASAA